MKTVIFAISVFLIVPALRAQQGGSKETAPQAAPQENAENSNVNNNSLPEAIRPGHPLDLADVDILTGKRDREIEASRSGFPYAVSGYYDAYSGEYALNGRRAATLNLPFLPLRPFVNPLFFFSSQRSASARGFGGGRHR
jgi:hypothetical protein